MADERPPEIYSTGFAHFDGPNEHLITPDRRLGRLPLKTTRKALQFVDFFRFVDIPKTSSYWRRKSPVPVRTFGNNEYGNCTRAKQAYAIVRMERIEQKRTVEITDEEVVRVYQEMILREYGSTEDNGAYEDDALRAWRNPEHTIRDTKGNPYAIDAYLRINALNHQEVKAGLALSASKGIAVCFNLPAAWLDVDPPAKWDVPEGQALIGKWMPGTWGGHSCWLLNDYTEEDVMVDDTWGKGPRRVTWRAMAAYMDEAHLVVDALNSWRKQSTSSKVKRALSDVRDAVNEVSSLQIP